MSVTAQSDSSNDHDKSERIIRHHYHFNCVEDRTFPMTLSEYRTAVVEEKETWRGALDWKGACIMVYNDVTNDENEAYKW